MLDVTPAELRAGQSKALAADQRQRTRVRLPATTSRYRRRRDVAERERSGGTRPPAEAAEQVNCPASERGSNPFESSNGALDHER